MTTSGPEMHRQLMDGYKEMQRRLEELRDDLSSVDVRRGELDDDRSRALADLAQHYLPELTDDAIASSWVEARDALSQVLMRKEDKRRRTTEALSAANDKRSIQEDRLVDLNQQLDVAKAEQDELSGQVESELAADQTFVSLSRQAAVAEAALERAEANLNEIEQDAARKLPAYEQSALFTYLRDRKYGTENYTRRGLTRRMDRWLSRFIDYPKASQGYEFLVNTPDQMRKIIAEDREALDTVMSEVEKRRDLVVDRLGLSAAIDKVEKLSHRREDQLLQLDKIREQTEDLESELFDLEDPRGTCYGEAVAVFRETLEKFNARDLADKAHNTPSPTDDQIVARLQGVEGRMEDLETDTNRGREQVRELKDAVQALGRMMQRFRASKFDAARSQFTSSLDIHDILRRVKNANDIDDAWDRIRKSQRWGPSPEDAIAGLASNPITQVLIGAMAQAAGETMSQHAGRAGRRRNESRRYKRSWSDDSSSGSRKGYRKP